MAMSILKPWRNAKVNGIPFRGQQNATPQIWTYPALGIGILSRESQFYVIQECNSITQVGQPCPSQTKSEFKDLRFGIYASNANANVRNRNLLITNLVFI